MYDGCPTAHALDLIGDRWALLVVRELLLGAKRFTDLLRGLPRISRNVLSQRLDDLEKAEVLIRRALPPPAASAVYELTDRGRELEVVLEAIGRWGVGSPLLPESDTVGADTFVLGLRRRYDPVAGGDMTASYELRIDMDVFAFEIDWGRLMVRRGAPGEPSPRLDADPNLIAGVARGETSLARSLTVSAAGTRQDVQAFSRLFHRVERG
jgi:DNA-binding HxlR family transcriptional regulator